MADGPLYYIYKTNAKTSDLSSEARLRLSTVVVKARGPRLRLKTTIQL